MIGDENGDDSVSMSTSQGANKSCVHHTNAHKSLRIVMLSVPMVLMDTSIVEDRI
jgi:hypothetical protein